MNTEKDMLAEDWSPATAVEADSPALFAELTESLSGKRRTLARDLDKGVAPDAFKKGQALLSSYDAALDGLEKARARRTGDERSS